MIAAFFFAPFTGTLDSLRDLYLPFFVYSRKKFRSQTSDKYGQMKGGGGKSKSRRREEKRRRKKIRKRKSQKKEDPGVRKGRKVAKHCFSNDLWFRRVEK